MKQIGSVITGSAKLSAALTGEQAGATGSETLPSLPPAPDLPTGWIGSARQMLSASTLRWLGTAYHQRQDGHTSGSLQIVIAGIDRDLEALANWMQPSDKANIIKTIEAMASLFQAPVPDQIGLDLYIMALARMPRPVFDFARNQLVLTHKWPRIPLPADFVAAGQEEQDRIEAVIAVLRTARRQAERALLTLR